MAFYELRQYEVRPGKMEAWVKLMDEQIVPLQVSKGMVIAGSFRGEGDLWLNELTEQVGRLINRETISVQRIVPTPQSILK